LNLAKFVGENVAEKEKLFDCVNRDDEEKVNFLSLL
jgi:hypothetical protein